MAQHKSTNVVPFRASPMLATLADAPFDRPGWVFEEKYDGVRILAYKEGERVSLFSRNAIDRTARYSGIAAAVLKLKARSLCIDGEIVVFDDKNISRFQLLQQGKRSAQFALFDCLFANGFDLRKNALTDRRETLEHLFRPTRNLLLSTRLAGDGLKAFQTASRLGLEGVVGKNLASTYTERRSSEWLKVKVHKQDEFVIGGFTEPTGSRLHFGALLLGVYAHGDFVYAGKVGTGFNEETLESLYGQFKRLIRSTSPFAADVPERNVTFLKPQLVAQVSYTEWTSDGKLRHPVYLGLRDDKNPEDVRRQN